jgi:hypothetical protein
MKKYATFVRAGLGLLLAAMTAGDALRAQGGPESGADLIRVTVTVTSSDKNAPPALEKRDVLVRQENDRRPVVDWVAAQDDRAALDFAILIDDSLDSGIGNQFDDIRAFLRSLPATARVGVAYSAHGSVAWRQEFTKDRELAAKALRLPNGRIIDGTSIYMALADMAKKWPKGGNRGAVLLITDGIDIFRGVSESEEYQDIDLQSAIEQAQRSGVTVYALFASGAARYRSNFYLIGNGQGCLLRLTRETGGEAYFQGSQTPVAIKPFLDEARETLSRQYVLTFRAQPGAKAGFARLHVSTEMPHVKLTAPEQVYIPAAP